MKQTKDLTYVSRRSRIAVGDVHQHAMGRLPQSNSARASQVTRRALSVLPLSDERDATQVLALIGRQAGRGRQLLWKPAAAAASSRKVEFPAKQFIVPERPFSSNTWADCRSY